MPLTRKHLVVTGRVQGVGFRWFASETARACGVTGWVRNRPDGTVEAEAQGTPAAVTGFVSALKKGPRFASVSEVAEQDVPAKAGDSDFEIR
ncbi:MAG: acylphosphatase [Elusimicrobia bacterium]|nr:acylphosphatase [Elusimicrobiota bacterium]